MYSDIQIPVIPTVQINQLTPLEYMPVSTSLFTLKPMPFDNKKINIATPYVDNLDEASPEVILTSDTEMYHVKVGANLFTYMPRLLGRAFNKPVEFATYDEIEIVNINAQVLKRFAITWDKNAILGTNNEQGLMNNPVTIANTATTPTNIANVSDLLGAIESLTSKIIDNTESEEGDIYYFLDGSNMRAFLAKTTGANPVINASLVNGLIGASNWQKLPTFVDNVDRIIAFIPNQVELYYFLQPELWDSGVNQERKYQWYQWAMSNCAVNILNNAIAVQPVTFT